jgi:glycogen(starch) synthase
VPHHEVDLYYGLIDILAYPRKAMRLTELVTPLKPLEAMAQGKLVVASNVGGHRELIEDGVTGTLFPAGDPAAIARGPRHSCSPTARHWERPPRRRPPLRRARS